MKKDGERGKQPSDEMPVMSTQVLMRAIALVDAPQGNVPMMWNSRMETEGNTACKRGNWSKTRYQQNCKIHIKYPYSYGELCTTICCHLSAILFMFRYYYVFALSCIKCHTEQFVDLVLLYLSCVFLIWHTSGYGNKLGGSVAAQSFMFLVREVTLPFLEACGGVLQWNIFNGITRYRRRAVWHDYEKGRWQGKEGRRQRQSDITGTKEKTAVWWWGFDANTHARTQTYTQTHLSEAKCDRRVQHMKIQGLSKDFFLVIKPLFVSLSFHV